MSQRTALAVNMIKTIAHDLIGKLKRTVRNDLPIIAEVD
jgi:hypothetical protein